MITNLKKKFAEAIVEGQWQAIGGGEVVSDLFIDLHPQDVANNCDCQCNCDHNCNCQCDCQDRIWVGELHGSNGTREEAWVDEVLGKSDNWFYRQMLMVKRDFPYTWGKIVGEPHLKDVVVVAKSYNNSDLEFEVITLQNWLNVPIYNCVSMVSQKLCTSQLRDKKIYLGCSHKNYYPDNVVVLKAKATQRFYNYIKMNSIDFYGNGLQAMYVNLSDQAIFFDLVEIFKND